MARKTVFKSIPGKDGKGYIALEIYHPGQFMPDIKEYAAFVGGCGVGHAKTLKAAERVLFNRAIQILTRRQAEAQALADHYKEAVVKLGRFGLQKVVLR